MSTVFSKTEYRGMAGCMFMIFFLKMFQGGFDPAYIGLSYMYIVPVIFEMVPLGWMSLHVQGPSSRMGKAFYLELFNI